MDEKSEQTLIDSIRRRKKDHNEIPSEFSRDMLLPEVKKTHNLQWSVSFYEAECRFYLTDRENAVIYHLNIPDYLEGRGIGTAMTRVAEHTIRNKTDAEVLKASVGTSNGATRHIFKNKCGFTIIGTKRRDGIGEVLEAEKSL